MPTPRCPDHGLSIGEYIYRFVWYRSYYRNIYNGDEVAVAAELVKMCNAFNIIGPCCRNMLLNSETLDSFIARRDKYNSNGATVNTSNAPRDTKPDTDNSNAN
jgi:hypothetical protein